MSRAANSPKPTGSGKPEEAPALDPDKPRRSEHGTDHVEEPEHVAEHLSEIERKDEGGDEEE